MLGDASRQRGVGKFEVAHLFEELLGESECDGAITGARIIRDREGEGVTTPMLANSIISSAIKLR